MEIQKAYVTVSVDEKQKKQKLMTLVRVKKTKNTEI